MNKNEFWDCESYGKTLSGAVDEFCNTYWDKPRKHTKITAAGEFRLRDGMATYWCRFVDNIPGVFRISKVKGEGTKSDPLREGGS